MKQLAITADDFGLARELDEGIKQACVEGVVTHVSLVANGENIDEAAKFLKNRPQTSVAIHLNITEGKPLSDPAHLKPLLDKEENFLGPGKHLDVGFTILVHPSVVKAVEEEYRAQITKVLSLGVQISQLNAHGHLHLHPYLFRTVIELALRYQVPFIRGVAEWWPGLSLVIRKPGRWSLSFALSLFTLWQNYFSRGALGTVNRSVGVFDSGCLTRQERLSQILMHLPNGFTELFCHPGTSSERLRKNNPGYDWDGERKLMTSRETKELIQRFQIRLTNFSAIKNAPV